MSAYVVSLISEYRPTLASPASMVGAACAPAQDVTDAIVRCKRLLAMPILAVQPRYQIATAIPGPRKTTDTSPTTPATPIQLLEKGILAA